MPGKRGQRPPNSRGIQDLIDKILTIPGTTREWIARAVEAGLSPQDAKRRVAASLWYYRKRKIMVPASHGREQLIDVEGKHGHEQNSGGRKSRKG